MFILIRTITYATLFIGLVLVFLPARILSAAGIQRPEVVGAPQVGGMVIGTVGALVALSCLIAFTFLGRGTPAAFDPPRRLVVRGPYKHVRNPMYIGAGLGLAGAALFYQSLELLGYTGALSLVTHFFVVFYEEPTLERSFGADYAAYRRAVRRWLPRL